jgi:hypothetical protein
MHNAHQQVHINLPSITLLADLDKLSVMYRRYALNNNKTKNSYLRITKVSRASATSWLKKEKT